MICCAELDDLKTFAGGLRAVYVEGHLLDWCMSLVANDLRWKYQVVCKCFHPGFKGYQGGPPARLAWARQKAWPFTWQFYVHYTEVQELFDPDLHNKVCPLRTVEALSFLDWPQSNQPLAARQLAPRQGPAKRACKSVG